MIYLVHSLCQVVHVSRTAKCSCRSGSKHVACTHTCCYVQDIAAREPRPHVVALCCRHRQRSQAVHLRMLTLASCMQHLNGRVRLHTLTPCCVMSFGVARQLRACVARSRTALLHLCRRRHGLAEGRRVLAEPPHQLRADAALQRHAVKRTMMAREMVTDAVSSYIASAAAAAAAADSAYHSSSLGSIWCIGLSKPTDTPAPRRQEGVVYPLPTPCSEKC